MENDNEFWKILRFLYGDGVHCDFGCSEEEIPEMVSLSQEMFPSKPYRVVRGWHWGDLDLDMQHLDRFSELGLQPSFIYAEEIVEDGSKRAGKGKSVRTSPLVEFQHSSLFVTQNTVYILVGTGIRMTVNLFVYQHLFSL